MSITRVRRAGRIRHLAAVSDAPDAWLVGPWDLPEFTALRGQVDAASEWPVLAEFSAVTKAIDDAATAPEVILLAEPRPGVHRQALIDVLAVAAPLTRIVVVAGAWCEGELRSGKPLTGVLRIYCHQLAAWWRAALMARAANLAPSWSAPIGVPHAIARNPVSRRLASKCIAIDATDLAVFEALASALRPAGATCHWATHEGAEARSPNLGIWDGGQLDADEQRRLVIFCKQLCQTPTPVLVLLDYPRPEHSEVIRAVGASALLGKPYSVDALIDALTRLADAPNPDA